MSNFCNQTCQSLASRSHRCIPSVSPQESRSVTVIPTCPGHVLDKAIHLLDHQNTIVTDSYSLHFNALNFSTLRIKLKESVNSLVFFSSTSTRYAIIKDIHEVDENVGKIDDCFGYARRVPSYCTGLKLPGQYPNDSLETVAVMDKKKKKKDDTAAATATTTAPEAVKWSTPIATECYCHFTAYYAATNYLLITPGPDMLASLVSKRLRARSNLEGEKERLSALQLPDAELIEYAQALSPRGNPDEPLVHVVEWVN